MSYEFGVYDGKKGIYTNNCSLRNIKKFCVMHICFTMNIGLVVKVLRNSNEF